MEIGSKNRLNLPKSLQGIRYNLIIYDRRIYFLSERMKNSFLENFLSFEERVFGSEKARNIGEKFSVLNVESDGRVLIPSAYLRAAEISYTDKLLLCGDADCFYLKKG